MDNQHEKEYRDNVQDLNKEAIEKGTTPEKLRQERSQEVKPVPGQQPSDRLVDGYEQTEGEDYADPQRDEREGYDPAHSGVRHPQNKPGAPTETPGREEGTAWSSQEQMGKLRDTYDKKNPSI
ncbi:hypothetical protein KDA_36450 [Dictyobacter alpinus]|uniref:Uncharacterized protein n=1 Tax=Dictyobacter alpinus TaxID=2014873 RepID=A0A402B9U9_9CHLR|nr:hypothetical protein [Dictyobacter alpinus]GCE28161.1 hypothetical protein KDA_36450 [Dictyobacter alpinus]